jgi:hypothetical protein
MSRSASYWAVVAALFSVAWLTHGAAAPVPARNEPDLPKLALEQQDDSRRLSERLIAVVEDLAIPEGKRWTAAMALADVGDRTAVEYLVEHIGLLIHPPFMFQSEDLGQRWVCRFALETRAGRGWDSDWNCVQAVFRALGKKRTESELVAYASVIDRSLGMSRYSDRTVMKQSRALALVEAELAGEEQPTRVPGHDDAERRDRLHNLKELKRMLLTFR